MMELNEKEKIIFWRAIATIPICFMGAFVMWVTNGETGIGWAIVGLLIVWDVI